MGFQGQGISDEDIGLAEIECLRVVAMAINFGTKIGRPPINWFCVNDSDYAICGGG